MKKVLCVLASVMSLNAASVCVGEISWTECVRYKPCLCVAASMVRFQQEIKKLFMEQKDAEKRNFDKEMLLSISNPELVRELQMFEHVGGLQVVCDDIENAHFNWGRMNHKIIVKLRMQWCMPMAQTAYLSFFLMQLMKSEDDLATPAGRLHQCMQDLLFERQTREGMSEKWRESIRQMNDLLDQIDPEQDPDYRKLLNFF